MQDLLVQILFYSMIYFHMSIPGMPTLIVRIVSMIKRIEDGQNKLLSIMFLSYEPAFGLSLEKSMYNIVVFLFRTMY